MEEVYYVVKKPYLPKILGTTKNVQNLKKFTERICFSDFIITIHYNKKY